jgi:hypothetical protein
MTDVNKKKRVSFGVQKEERRAKAISYKKIGASAVSLIAMLCTFCMGESVADANSRYDPERAAIENRIKLLRAIEKQAKVYKVYKPPPPPPTIKSS